MQAGCFREVSYSPGHLLPSKRLPDPAAATAGAARRHPAAGQALLAPAYRKALTGLTRQASDAPLAYDYPGNVRELQNLAERGVINALDGGPIDAFHMFEDAGFSSSPGAKLRINAAGDLETAEREAVSLSRSPETPAASNTEDAEKERKIQRLERVLGNAEGNVSRAARDLSITRAKLAYRLQKLGLDPSRYRYPNDT